MTYRGGTAEGDGGAGDGDGRGLRLGGVPSDGMRTAAGDALQQPVAGRTGRTGGTDGAGEEARTADRGARVRSRAAAGATAGPGVPASGAAGVSGRVDVPGGVEVRGRAGVPGTAEVSGRVDASPASYALGPRVPGQRQEVRRTGRPGGSVSAVRLGRRLRMSRRRLGLTQDAVSGRTGLSKSFLSQVEAGRANPTLESLHRLADAVETPLSVLLAGPGPAALAGAARPPGALALSTTYRPAREGGRWAAGEGRTYPLTAPGARRFETVLVEGTAAHHALVTSHPGEELCHVLAGRLRAEVDGERFALAAGDSLHYDSALAHRLTALCAGTRFLLQVAGPPVA